MSTRTNLQPCAVIGKVANLPTSNPAVSGDMSAGITSAPSILGGLTVGTYTYSWSGTSPVGTLAVQISNDYAVSADGRTVLNAGTWIPVYFVLNGSTTVNSGPVTGNTGVAAIEWSTGAHAIRTVYAASSGSGTLQAVVSGKVT